MVSNDGRRDPREIWVESHRVLVDEVLRSFLDSGEWPEREELQRTLDRRSIADNVEAAWSQLVAAQDVPADLSADRFVISMQTLQFVPAARPVLDAALELVWRSRQLYLSMDNAPRLTSADEAITQRIPDAQRLRRAFELLLQTSPRLFGSGHKTDSLLSFEINRTTAAKLNNVQTIGDFFGLRSVPVPPLKAAAASTEAEAQRRPLWSRWLSRAGTEAGLWAVAAAVIGAIVLGLITWYVEDHRRSDASGPGASTRRTPPSTSVSSSTKVVPPGIVPAGHGKADKGPCTPILANTKTSGTQIACIPLNDIVKLDCSTKGDIVTGEFDTSNLWDRLVYKGKAGYVPDAYLYTGSNAAVVSPC